LTELIRADRGLDVRLECAQTEWNNDEELNMRRLEEERAATVDGGGETLSKGAAAWANIEVNGQADCE
jgi:hypothetical protein